MLKNNLLLIAIISALLFYQGCDTTESEDVADNSRIIPGVSFEGVALGDYEEIVIDKIGEPDNIGHGGGSSKMYKIYNYDSGEYSGLHILFVVIDPYNAPYPEEAESGPADLLSVYPPYSGTTKDGIGIGTDMEFVIQTWGEAEVTVSPAEGYAYHTYYFSNNKVYIGYENNLINYMRFGPFIQTD